MLTRRTIRRLLHHLVRLDLARDDAAWEVVRERLRLRGKLRKDRCRAA